mmetsp:Transcript_23427/g.39958  ORF Transcript_23427/g.39958 Transcript_23427/m.39958 type:complete len:244 (-) Transcript_23427:148-879(-)
MFNCLGRRMAPQFCRQQHSSIKSSPHVLKSCSAHYQPHQVETGIQSRKLSHAEGACSTLPRTLFNNTSRSEHYIQQHRYTTASLRCNVNKPGPNNYVMCCQIRLFQNVSQYHNVADDTLHTIQDAVEDLIEDNFDNDTNNSDDDTLPEVNYASGVLTMSLPPHGTWVINKQTPNQQLWWSSPISGPRRYEYVEERERWVYTRVIEEGDGKECAEVAENDDDTLGSILTQELKELYGWDLDVEA